jgi:hypothetical protein
VALDDLPDSPAFDHVVSLLPVFVINARDRRRNHPTHPALWDFLASLQPMIGQTVPSAPAGWFMSSGGVSPLEDGEGLRSQSDTSF